MQTLQGITYIITTYNRPGLLQKAVLSVVQERAGLQDTPAELIVLDDHSDQPIALPGTLTSEFNGDVRVLRNTKRQGVSAARNRGIEESRFGFLLFLDDDDTSMPQRSRILYPAIRDSGFAFVAAKSIMGSGAQEKRVPEGSATQLDPLAYLIRFPHINSVIWNRLILQDMGGMDTQIPYFGEHIAALRALLAGQQAIQITDAVARFSYIGGGMTQKALATRKLRDDLLGLYELLLASHNSAPEFIAVCARMYARLQKWEPESMDAYLAELTTMAGESM